MTPSWLDDSPSDLPAESRPFWTRLKVGVAAGVVGLAIGLVGGGASGESGASAAASLEGPDQAATELVEVIEDNSRLEEELRDTRQESKVAVRSAVRRVKRESLATQRRAVRTAVTKARAAERAKTAAAVRAARVSATTAADAATAPAPSASTGGATDPRFSWCYEANDSGYGPYYRGQDPEYDWYDDADGDGVVCET